MKIRKTEFHNRLYRRLDELKWLYMELYRDEEAFDYFVKMLQSCWSQRKQPLRELDTRREGDPSRSRRRYQPG